MERPCRDIEMEAAADLDDPVEDSAQLLAIEAKRDPAGG
jgi:hypothetical protein